MKLIMIVAAVLGMLVGCGSGGKDQAASTAPTVSQPSTPAVEVPAPTTPAEDKPGLAASEVLAAFQAAKLPVRNPRDNSRNCDGMQLGCVQLMTTDDVSIYVFVDPVAQEAFAQQWGEDGFVVRNVVLSYAAARTPAKLRPKYQAVLTRLAG